MPNGLPDISKMLCVACGGNGVLPRVPDEAGQNWWDSGQDRRAKEIPAITWPLLLSDN